ncbi:DUF4241 domain-containing protein [Streptomyces manipurensis]|uniref:DUF4241 domain-containing protein n=1 Tax=Streptomyces manipurensis TaxID=1077945 RepID=UPI003C702637
MDRGSGTGVEVTYAQGWDPVSRTAGPELSAAEAAARDAAGTPYVVLHREPGSGTPSVVRYVSWEAGIVEVWGYDGLGRPVLEADLSLLSDETLLLNRRLIVRSRPDDPADGPESGDDRDLPRTVVEISAEGRARISHQPQGVRGDWLEAAATVPREDVWSARPAFGAWPALPAGDGLPDWVREHLATAGTPDAPVPWDRRRSPVFSTVDIGARFRPGTPLGEGPYGGPMTSAEPKPAGTLTLPGGLLAVGCPLAEGPPEIVIPVPPGEYALDEARATLGRDGERRGGWQEEESTALRVRLGEAPAVTWEMALGPGDDPRHLGSGEAYGFGTDGATGAFGDAAEWESLRQRCLTVFEDGDFAEWDPDAEPPAFAVRVREPASGAELAAFALASDGVHPVWLGRARDGELVAVVVVRDA